MPDPIDQSLDFGLALPVNDLGQRDLDVLLWEHVMRCYQTVSQTTLQSYFIRLEYNPNLDQIILTGFLKLIVLEKALLTITNRHFKAIAA